MIHKIRHIIKRIKEGVFLERWRTSGWILSYIRHYWKDMSLYTVLGFFQAVLSLLSSLISKDLVDIITGHQTNSLIKNFVLFISFSVFNILFGQLSSYFSSRIGLKVDTEIKADLFDRILETDWESLTRFHTGDLLTRWNSDTSTLSNGILTWFPNLIINFFRFLSSFIVILYYDKTFALLALSGLPISALISHSLVRRMQKNNRESASIHSKISGFNQEVFSNLQTIKAFDALHIYSRYLKELQAKQVHMRFKFQKISMITSMLMSFIGIAVSYVCFGWGIHLVWSGAISYGTMTMFLSLSSSMSSNMNSLISMIPTAVQLTTSAARLKDILDMPKEVYPDKEQVDALYHSCKDKGLSLVIKDLDYTYQTGNPVFYNCSFEAHPHEIIALIGPSGQGKTTLLRIILSLLNPQNGECIIYPRGEENQALSLSPSTRKLFSYVPQGNTIFSGTIADNMRSVKQDATDEEIVSALKHAYAWEFVEKLSDGIYSSIKERGGGFSEGQAQRLSIARALLRRSPILLLDEATSALDPFTEKKVLEGIMDDPYPRTCIVTTHRYSVLQVCTRVYQVKDFNCKIVDDYESFEINSDIR